METEIPTQNTGPLPLPSKNFLADPSLWLLFFSNGITIFFALTEHWSLATVLWIYWFQSVTIGFFNVIRILELKNFSTKGFQINGKEALPTTGTKIYTAFFFLFHFGLFHLVYLGFMLANTTAFSFGSLYQKMPAASLPFTNILLAAGIFFINHLFSYLYHRSSGTPKKQNIGSLMFYPYLRIVPMHFTLILGAIFSNALPFFLLLKTFSDALMHVVEHTVLQKN